MIRFDRVSKRFHTHRQRPRSFHELFIEGWKLWWRQPAETFWALRDVSFEVQPGETVGLIGPNGAGKSTVLKLAARILEPTSGRVMVRGRVAALLELGVGFHPELTGRENVFLSGAFLGIPRREMARRLDAIVAFAELEDYIDVPVKHYSSGMYVRLAFAVSVYLDAEILLVDEVLAVGDAAFQQKCMDHLFNLQRSGVTILLVSHDLNAVQRLCHRALWFDHGRIRMEGAPAGVVQAYLDHVHRRDERTLAPQNQEAAFPRWGNGRLRIERVYLTDAAGMERYQFETGEMVRIHLRYRALERVERPVFGLAIHRHDGVQICGPNTAFSGFEIPWVDGEGELSYTIPSLPLLEGTYLISVSATDERDIETFDYHDRAYMFRVIRGRHPERYGLMAMNGRWAHDRLSVSHTALAR
ncbi:Teichoic acids export ATP-binding protein TagH [Candidatus Thermoflexus japonica]|uniref:Teichoic acids export ATP-binding protein TagH n=1 Tax=Candidatus Thermoflexus japonica TaxID=2035417 RepID=A0A2H5Y3C7_9CHLR|nr:Teichoic acids export ATP-binding protein TagH [Candidatus Thermoflexus japonica]